MCIVLFDVPWYGSTVILSVMSWFLENCMLEGGCLDKKKVEWIRQASFHGCHTFLIALKCFEGKE